MLPKADRLARRQVVGRVSLGGLDQLDNEWVVGCADDRLSGVEMVPRISGISRPLSVNKLLYMRRISMERPRSRRPSGSSASEASLLSRLQLPRGETPPSGISRPLCVSVNKLLYMRRINPFNGEAPIASAISP